MLNEMILWRAKGVSTMDSTYRSNPAIQDHVARWEALSDEQLRPLRDHIARQRRQGFKIVPGTAA